MDGCFDIRVLPTVVALQPVALGTSSSSFTDLLRRQQSFTRPHLLREMRRWLDKAGATEEVKALGLPVMRNYAVSARCDEVAKAVERLDSQDYVLKPTVAFGCVLLVRDGVVLAHKQCQTGPIPTNNRQSWHAFWRRGAAVTPAAVRTFCAAALAQPAELAYLLPRPTTQKTDPAKAMWPPRVVAQELRIRADGSDQPADDVKCWVCYGGTVAIQHVASRFNTTAGHEGGAGKRDDFYVLSNVSSGATRGVQEEDAAATTTAAAAGLDEPMVMMMPWEGAALTTGRLPSAAAHHAHHGTPPRLPQSVLNSVRSQCDVVASALHKIVPSWIGRIDWLFDQSSLREGRGGKSKATRASTAFNELAFYPFAGFSRLVRELDQELGKRCAARAPRAGSAGWTVPANPRRSPG